MMTRNIVTSTMSSLALVQLLLMYSSHVIMKVNAIPHLNPTSVFGLPNKKDVISSSKKLLDIRGGGRRNNDSHKGNNGGEIINASTAVTVWDGPLTYNETETNIGSIPISTLLQSLQTNPITGLTDEEASKRCDMYGRNTLQTPPGKSLFKLTLEQFDDKLVQILLFVAILSGFFSYFEMKAHIAETGEAQSLLKSFVEPIVIVAILVLNAIVGVWQGKSAEGSLEALKKLQPSLATVLRNGEWKDNIDSSELVPGDIIKFRVGDKISADARILSMDSSTLSIDEGSLTGESVTVQKLPGDEGLCDFDAPVQDMQSVVFSGTVCTAGSAVAVVTRTGMETEIGKIQKVGSQNVLIYYIASKLVFNSFILMWIINFIVL